MRELSDGVEESLEFLFTGSIKSQADIVLWGRGGGGSQELRAVLRVSQENQGKIARLGKVFL